MSEKRKAESTQARGERLNRGRIFRNSLKEKHSPPVDGEAPILNKLSNIGYCFRSLHDMRNAALKYDKAIPILIEELGLPHDRKLAEEIVRTLTVKWARPAAAPPLIDLFTAARDHEQLGGLAWVVGNALEVVADDSVFDQIASLVVQKRFGRAREMIVLGLARSARPDAVDILIELTEDPDVDGHAVAALAKLNSPRAEPILRGRLNDRRAWVRRAAKTGLHRLENAA